MRARLDARDREPGAPPRPGALLSTESRPRRWKVAAMPRTPAAARVLRDRARTWAGHQSPAWWSWSCARSGHGGHINTPLRASVVQRTQRGRHHLFRGDAGQAAEVPGRTAALIAGAAGQ